MLQPLRAFAFAPLAVHAAVHSPAGHLLLTETHVYAAAARYVHTAVAAGFTAGWYIEHKLALTPGHGESAASHPSPDGGRTHGEDAPREVVRARDTSIGHLTGAARLFSGSVHAPMTCDMFISSFWQRLVFLDERLTTPRPQDWTRHCV